MRCCASNPRDNSRQRAETAAVSDDRRPRRRNRADAVARVVGRSPSKPRTSDVVGVACPKDAPLVAHKTQPRPPPPAEDGEGSHSHWRAVHNKSWRPSPVSRGPLIEQRGHVPKMTLVPTARRKRGRLPYHQRPAAGPRVERPARRTAAPQAVRVCGGGDAAAGDRAAAAALSATPTGRAPRRGAGALAWARGVASLDRHRPTSIEIPRIDQSDARRYDNAALVSDEPLRRQIPL